MSVTDGPGEGTWAVFAEKVVAERDEARAEVVRLKAAQTWQPIATVPKGVGVLCLIGAEGVIESAIIGDDDRPDLWGATHWVLVGELGRAPKGPTP